MKEKGNPHPGKPHNQWKDLRSQRDLQNTKESAAAGLRTQKQSERSTDHLNHWCRHHSLRCLGGGWVLKLRLHRSVPRIRLGMVVWRQPKGLRNCTAGGGSGMIRAGEWKTTAEGTREKF